MLCVPGRQSSAVLIPAPNTSTQYRGCSLASGPTRLFRAGPVFGTEGTTCKYRAAPLVGSDKSANDGARIHGAGVEAAKPGEKKNSCRGITFEGGTGKCHWDHDRGGSKA